MRARETLFAYNTSFTTLFAKNLRMLKQRMLRMTEQAFAYALNEMFVSKLAVTQASRRSHLPFNFRFSY